MQFRHALAHADTLMWLDRWEEGCAELDDVLDRFAPDLWTGRDLYIITKLIAGTQNPAIWKHFISIWLELFARHERLTTTGSGLGLAHSCINAALDQRRGGPRLV